MPIEIKLQIPLTIYYIQVIEDFRSNHCNGREADIYGEGATNDRFKFKFLTGAYLVNTKSGNKMERNSHVDWVSKFNTRKKQQHLRGKMTAINRPTNFDGNPSWTCEFVSGIQRFSLKKNRRTQHDFGLNNEAQRIAFN